jgi:MFS family permease
MNQFRLLLTRRLCPMFVTQFLGALNDNVYRNALALFIAFTLADRLVIDSNLLIVLAGGIFILPFFLFSATAGQLADKYEKSMLIRHVKLAEIIIMSLGALSFLLESIILLMFALFLTGFQSAMFGPLKYGILPQLLSFKELTGGNGMVQMGTYLAILLGTMLGGVLIAIEDVGAVYVTIAILLVAMLGWFASWFIPRAEPPAPELKVNLNFITQTVRIIGHAWYDRAVFVAIVSISWFWFLGATFLSLVPGYARDFLLGGEHVATMLLTAFSVGIGIGALLCERFSRHGIEFGLVIIGSLGITAFALDLFLVGQPALTANSDDPLTAAEFLAQAQSWRVLLDLTGIGLCGGMYIVPLYTMVQHRADPAHRARIIAANNVLNALLMVGSALFTMGLLAAGATIPVIFGLVAAGNMLFLLVVLRRLEGVSARLQSWRRLLWTAPD